jgi:hypothetical protein
MRPGSAAGRGATGALVVVLHVCKVSVDALARQEARGLVARVAEVLQVRLATSSSVVVCTALLKVCTAKVGCPSKKGGPRPGDKAGRSDAREAG